MNIVFSELWESPPPDEATMKQRFDNAVFPVGVDERTRLYPLWPKYPADEFVGKLATTATPLLMMGGTLDIQTPIELQEKLKSHSRRQTRPL